MRPGDCPGNDIWSLYRDRTTLKECARLCSTSPSCQAFMFYNNHRCYPKTKTCATATKTNPLNMFYDKVPRGFAMRPGDCSGNDIWSIHGFVSLMECARRCKANPSCVACSMMAANATLRPGHVERQLILRISSTIR